jgi:hypothetical protein
VKITVEIADSLLQEARACAESRGWPLRRLVEEGLRVATQSAPSRKRFRLRDGSFGGRGLVDKLGWEEIRKRAYQGRGEASQSQA